MVIIVWQRQRLRPVTGTGLVVGDWVFCFPLGFLVSAGGTPPAQRTGRLQARQSVTVYLHTLLFVSTTEKWLFSRFRKFSIRQKQRRSCAVQVQPSQR
jgi:hypothetical protein